MHQVLSFLGTSPRGERWTFLALGRYEGKGSGVLVVNSQGEVVLGGGEGRVRVHVIREKLSEVDVLTFGYLGVEFPRERWEGKIVFIGVVGNNLLSGTLRSLWKTRH